jgi:hypothetical protein
VSVATHADIARITDDMRTAEAEHVFLVDGLLAEVAGR